MQKKMAGLQNSTSILVFDGASNIQIEPAQSVLLMKNFEQERLQQNLGIAPYNDLLL